ncbi:Glutathione S-transferase Mu 1, partial [Characodon lateralis]|nr:Glutathione S-transferase Mu 1 [Characodon lateralis]
RQHHHPLFSLKTRGIKMTMLLAYWDVRGFVGHIRLMLEYTKSDYKEKFYVVGDAPGFDKSCWFNEKFKLGLDFPNLPYLIDGDKKVTQSMAILRYIARKHNLCEYYCPIQAFCLKDIYNSVGPLVC